MIDTLTPPEAITPATPGPAVAPPSADAPPEDAADGSYTPLFRLSVERYHAMIDAGVFADDERVELLEGVLVRAMSKNPIHSAVTRILQYLLAAMLPDGYFISPGEPITTDDSEPEPDLCVVRGKLTDFFKRHPTPAESALIVEVANSSLQRDRTVKCRIYANANCRSYWIVNTIDASIEVYGDPTPGSGYSEPTTFRRGQRVPVTLDGTVVGEIGVDELFPTLD